MPTDEKKIISLKNKVYYELRRAKKNPTEFKAICKKLRDERSKKPDEWNKLPVKVRAWVDKIIDVKLGRNENPSKVFVYAPVNF